MRSPGVGEILAYPLRHWPNITPQLGYRLVFGGWQWIYTETYVRFRHLPPQGWLLLRPDGLAVSRLAAGKMDFADRSATTRR